jgi:hypothetical protein
MDPRKVLKFKKVTGTPREEEEEDTDMNAGSQPAGIDVVSSWSNILSVKLCQVFSQILFHSTSLQTQAAPGKSGPHLL